MNRKIFSFVCPFAIVAVFGLLYCARVGYLTLTDRLACAGDACVTLQRTAVAKPFGVPLAFFGVAFYACALLLLASSGTSRLKALQAMAGIGAFAGVGLLAYGWVIAGAFCPWCTVSTATTLCLLAASTSSPLQPLSARGTVAALCVSALMVGGAEWSIRRSLGADGEYLGNLPFARLIDQAHRIDPVDSRAEIGTALFVNMECHSCRRTLRELLERPEPFALHFAGGSETYGRPAALAVLKTKAPRDRARLLSRLLADDAVNPGALTRTLSTAGNLANPTAESAYGDDMALSQKLKIRGLPAIFTRAESHAGPYWRTADAP